MIAPLLARFPVGARVTAAAHRAEARLAALPPRGDADAAARVQRAFADEGPGSDELAGTLGYGYGDPARARYEGLLARIFGAEAAFARLSFVSGTHAIVTALAACAPPGGRIVAATGRPYDTLASALSLAPRALTTRGIGYVEIPLAPSGDADPAALAAELAGPRATAHDVVFVQRSRGYAPRRSLSARACGAIAATARAAAPSALVLVDNCYGELVDPTEPTHHGADLVMGSLIKNLGGSLAPAGGYVIGRAELVARVADFHVAPGLGAAVGSSLGFGRALLQGLFLAPLVLRETLAGLDFFAALFEELGCEVDPVAGAERHDIVQAIRLGDAVRLLAFARGLQRAMPLDARFVPEPGPVPGYPAPVVMSGGGFVPGATIELSCDAPLRAPFEVYVQGGVDRVQSRLGALLAADELYKDSS